MFEGIPRDRIATPIEQATPYQREAHRAEQERRLRFGFARPQLFKRGGAPPTPPPKPSVVFTTYMTPEQALLNFAPWPAEKTAELRRLVAEGLCPKQIASSMGLGYRTVVSKCRRLKLRPAHEKGRSRAASVLKAFAPPTADDEQRADAAAAAAHVLFERGPFCLTMEAILVVVSRYYRVSKVDIVSARVTRSVILPRQICCWLARRLTILSYPQIGRRLCRVDHTTQIHSFRRIEFLREQNPELAAQLA